MSYYDVTEDVDNTDLEEIELVDEDDYKEIRIEIVEEEDDDIPEERETTPKKFYHKTEATPDAQEYLNNEKFGQMLDKYNKSCILAESREEKIPVIPNEIAKSIMKIVTNLAKAPNFSNYTWLDEMKLDAIENCIRYLRKFNIDAPTRTGKPEAFSYFTRISYFAFLRRIDKEKREIAFKDKLIAKYNLYDSIDTMFEDDTDTKNQESAINNYSEKAKNNRGL